MPMLFALALTLVLQSPANAVPDLASTIDALSAVLQERYIDLDVADRMTAAIRKEQADGVYARLTTRGEAAQALTRTLQAISHDKHLRVFETPPSPAALASKPVVGRVDILPGNIGYLEVPSLAQPPAAAAPVIADAMRKVAETSALIIDVRGNGGGSPATVGLLAAYVLEPESVLLGTIENRFQHSRVENRTPATVAGPRYGTTRPVFVLIDRRSASAAESLAYFLQAFQRATIVGAQSAGAANPGGLVRLPADFAAFVPTGRVTSPATGGNWEGTGVTPDLATGATEALDAALKAARDATTIVKPAGIEPIAYRRRGRPAISAGPPQPAASRSTPAWCL